MHAVLALFTDVRRDNTIGRDLVVLTPAKTVTGLRKSEVGEEMMNRLNTAVENT